jgi:hypothetical protein
MIMRALPASIAALLIAMPAFAQDKATIDKLNTEVMAAFAKGDMAALGQMYTADASRPIVRPSCGDPNILDKRCGSH